MLCFLDEVWIFYVWGSNSGLAGSLSKQTRQEQREQAKNCRVGVCDASRAESCAEYERVERTTKQLSSPLQGVAESHNLSDLTSYRVIPIFEYEDYHRLD